MTMLPVTTTTTALLGLIFVVLSARVIMARGSSKTSLGDGGHAATETPLFYAVRGHANFAEYVPLALLLLGGVEAASASRVLVLGLAGALVIGRIVHPIGIGMKAPNPFRAGGAVLTLGVLTVASVYLLVRLAAA